MIETTVGLTFILIVLLLCLSQIEDRNKLRAKPFFRWYDLWIGAYIDRDNQAVYICPIPMFGIKVSWNTAPKTKKKKEPRLSGELRPESYCEGDTVEFIENLSDRNKSIGKRGTVTKRWIKDIGWVVIRVETDNGTEHDFEWHNIKAIRKVIY